MTTHEPNTLNGAPRLEPSIPHEVSIEVLTANTNNNNATFKKHMLRSRDRVIDFPRTAPKVWLDKVVAKLCKLGIRQLSRLLTKTTNRHRRNDALLKALGDQSAFRPVLVKQQNALAHVHLAALAEASRRSMSRTRGGDPNNDNNITGPTS